MKLDRLDLCEKLGISTHSLYRLRKKNIITIQPSIFGRTHSYELTEDEFSKMQYVVNTARENGALTK